MQLMSSKMTFFYKRIFPVIWFGFLAVFFVIALIQGLAAQSIAFIPFIIVAVVMAVIGYQFMKRMAFNLVDEVFDVGDALLVRSGGQEERVALADIKNVNFFPYMSPPQVTLSLRRPSVFGDTIVFCAPARLLPLSRNPTIEKLIDRIDAARQNG
jgi:flagellar biosynthesis protein FliQ